MIINVFNLFIGRELVPNTFKNGLFSLKPTQENQILTPKQTFQRLLIALAQVRASNTSENFLNKIRQIIYFLYRT